MPNYTKFSRYAVPDLIGAQRSNFCCFLEFGLPRELDNFPVVINSDKDIELSLSSKMYRIRPPKNSVVHCKTQRCTYCVEVYITARLTHHLKGKVESCVDSNHHLCNLPLMTNEGSFIFRGVERVIVNQLVRCPGIYYTIIHDKKNRRIFIGTLISSRGNWLKFIVNGEDPDPNPSKRKDPYMDKTPYIQIGGSKIPAYNLLRALEFTEDRKSVV